MYKISDISSHVWGEIKKGLSNHLFLLVFIFFIVFLGTSGIWVIPTYINEEIYFWDAFDKVGVLTYCAPLLSLTIFDATLRALVSFINKDENAKIDLYIWGSLFTIILVVLIAISISNAPQGAFSLWSMISLGLALLYWFVVNAGNDAYQSQRKPTRNDYDNSEMLMDGKK